MFRTIRFKLALWYMVGIVATFAVAGAVVYQYVRTTLTAAQVEAMSNELAWFVTRSELGQERREPPEVVGEDLREHVARFPGREFVEIWDEGEGRLRFRSRSLGQDTLKNHLGARTHQGGVAEAVLAGRQLPIRILSQRRPSGLYLLGMPTASVAGPLQELVTVLLWLTPVVLLIGAVGGLSFAAVSFRKINQIVETAKRITADRLQDRLPAYPVDDEIGKLVSTFNEMISRLDVSFQRMKEFSADASHELRTPIAVMRTQLETALHSRATVGELRESIANCLDATLRLAATIDDLLLLARADAGQDVLARDGVDLRKLVKETYEESVILASQKSITVSLESLEDVRVRGDEARLRQMLLNVIDNAIKYNREGGTIRISLRNAGGKGEITVADSGIGIPESEIPRIFDRFYRVDKTRSRAMGGAGLGLSIVQWIVAAHGGSVAVRSAAGEGTSFAVKLPVISELH